MVQDVGTYIEIMQHEPEFTSCSLDTILREASRRLADGGWTTPVAQELVGAKGLALDADPHLLRSLFYHLLQNSVEAVQGVEKPIVSVTARAEGVPSPVNLRVEVFNNGPVPAADELEHLFTPFYSSNPTGTGFGLPIAALVARKIQAEIDLTAIPGEGTCVTVILPLRRN
jgi:signal transduction histidine kinase